MSRQDNTPLNRWEQVFIYNHMAQGGKALPSGKWKGLEEFPNTVSKLVSMRDQVETPLLEKFSGRKTELLQAALAVGGRERADAAWGTDLAILFNPLPRVPVMLLFWEEISGESFGAKVKLLFDATVTEHLDIESIIFLSEHLRRMLCKAADSSLG